MPVVKKIKSRKRLKILEKLWNEIRPEEKLKNLPEHLPSTHKLIPFSFVNCAIVFQ